MIRKLEYILVAVIYALTVTVTINPSVVGYLKSGLSLFYAFPSKWFWLLFFSAMPVVFIPSLPVDRRPSLIIVLTIYLIIYVPFICLSLHKYLLPEALKVNFVFFAGFIVMFLSYKIPLFKFEFKGVFFWDFIIVMCACFLIGYCSYKFFFHLNFFHLLNYKHIREASSVNGNIITKYGALMLMGCFLPFLTGLAVYAKKNIFYVLVAAGFFVLHSGFGSRLAFGIFLWLFAVQYLLMLSKLNFFRNLVFHVCILMSIFTMMPRCLYKIFYGLFNYRTFFVPSLVLHRYYEFFKDHPKTYLSHAKVFNLFIDYPYDRPLPSIIPGGGSQVVMFWGADGLAGFGLPGVIIISVILAVFLYVIDCSCQRFKNEFCMLALAGTAFALVNVSFFTVFLSWGLFFLILTFLFFPEKKRYKLLFKESL